jgi:hypothetical protein
MDIIEEDWCRDMRVEQDRDRDALKRHMKEEGSSEGSEVYDREREGRPL